MLNAQEGIMTLTAQINISKPVALSTPLFASFGFFFFPCGG
jgi:hypothetical protein